MTYTVVATREDDGRYSVYVPALPGCVSWGHDVHEALRMIEEAIELYLETLEEDGLKPPRDVAEVTVDMAETREAVVYKLHLAERETGLSFGMREGAMAVA